MKKLFIFGIVVLLLATIAFSQTRTVQDTRTNWYWAQHKMTIAAGASPDTTTFTNSFFNAVILTPNDSTYIKIGTYKNSWTAVDSLFYLPANVPFYVPGYWGVKYLYVEMGAAGANDAGAVYISGDKQVTE